MKAGKRKKDDAGDVASTRPCTTGSPLIARPPARVYLNVTCAAATHVIPLFPDDRKVVGRDEKVSLHVDDPTLSRRHAEITLKGDRPVVADLGSTNGTFVNGRKIGGPTEIGHGDVVRLGSTQIGVVETFASARARQGVQAPVESRTVTRDEPAAILIKDPSMVRLYAYAERIAPSFSSVILMGETGTGKEVMARHIHQSSKVCKGPFVPINCSTIPEAIAESELFGHEKGAFTGAAARKTGHIEEAHGGTLFLDEVTDLPPPVQPKLLRFLDDRKITRLGGTGTIEVDVRLVCATNRDIEGEVRAGKLRADLYYRLNQFSIYIPPLRSRPLEIPAFAEFFLKAMAGRTGMKTPVIAPDAVQLMMSYPWPGNIRELRNVMERVVVMAGQDGITKDLVHAILKHAVGPADNASGMYSKIEQLERKMIVDALSGCGGNQTRAARMLGISRRTLLYRLQKYGLGQGNLK
jgi:two-component system response regulator AtoC